MPDMVSDMSTHQLVLTTSGLAPTHSWCHQCPCSGPLWLGNGQTMELSFLKWMGNVLTS